MKDTVRCRFDEILSQHFERLIGTKQGIGGIPLNLPTIGCLVLLGGREIEIENSPSGKLERYTHELLFNEATDLCIEPDEFLKTALEDIIQKGYIEVDSDGRFFSRQTTITMVRLLDRIFPKMPGINLIAYAGQTIAEVTTGRTDIESAISRFDQTLKHHGVPFSRQKSSGVSPSINTVTTPTSQTVHQQKRINREQILAELYSRDKSSQESIESSSPRRSLTVLSGGGVMNRIKVDDILPKEENLPETICKSEANKEEQPVELLNGTEHSLLLDVNARNTYNEEDTQPIEEGVGYEIITTDDSIADQIAAFEKDLSLTCPICRESVLKEQSTATGKIYYTCPHDSCNFISWGKPHHIECGRCKNPFLIEVTDISGEAILKCPRATCQHRQNLSPQRVKVVRKRLVRRRK
jgi:ssDNA-binding Zn-finger/Zn-ribbon topoisomerase 1